MGAITPLHLILVLVVALLVLGPGKLPDVGAALGKSIREFRKATSDVEAATGLGLGPATTTPAPAPAAQQAAPTPTPTAAAASISVEPPSPPTV